MKRVCVRACVCGAGGNLTVPHTEHRYSFTNTSLYLCTTRVTLLLLVWWLAGATEH